MNDSLAVDYGNMFYWSSEPLNYRRWTPVCVVLGPEPAVAVHGHYTPALQLGNWNTFPVLTRPNKL